MADADERAPGGTCRRSCKIPRTRQSRHGWQTLTPFRLCHGPGVVRVARDALARSMNKIPARSRPAQKHSSTKELSMSGMTRRDALRVIGAGAAASLPATAEANVRRRLPAWAQGPMTGAEALVAALQ